jgi:hypothetical protein
MSFGAEQTYEFFRAGDWASCLSALQRLAKLRPRDKALYHNLLVVQLLHERCDKAQQTLEALGNSLA